MKRFVCADITFDGLVIIRFDDWQFEVLGQCSFSGTWQSSDDEEIHQLDLVSRQSIFHTIGGSLPSLVVIVTSAR